jgi:hypothetical protein
MAHLTSSLIACVVKPWRCYAYFMGHENGRRGFDGNSPVPFFPLPSSASPQSGNITARLADKVFSANGSLPSESNDGVPTVSPAAS